VHELAIIYYGDSVGNFQFSLFRLVFFKTQYAAAIASQTLIHGEDNREFRVEAAPGPDEVRVG
jgi:hypothetical protein